MRVQRLTVRHPGAPRPALVDVEFAVAPGQRIALVGANGSGKSTLLGALAGLLPASSGSIEFAGAIGTRSVGLVLQNPDLMLTCATVGQELLLGSGGAGWLGSSAARPQQGARRFARASRTWPQPPALSTPTPVAGARQTASALEIADLWDDPPLALSQGQRLRVALAAVLATAPRVLALDEPTTGQDPGPMTALFAALDALLDDGRLGAVLFATHDVRAVARWADRVLVLADGQLLADCPILDFLAGDALLSAAAMRPTPLLRLRRRLGLRGRDAAALAQELSP